MSIYLKACLRCHGDLFTEYDAISGQELTCLQCGRRYKKVKVLGDYAVFLDENGNVPRFEPKRTHSMVTS